MRKTINGIVKNYAMNNGGNYEACYNKLYTMFNKKNHCYIKSRAKRNNFNSVIGYIESIAQLDSLLELAVNLYK